jgi:hypothetical protein
VRARRADLAVANAQIAIAGGDREAAEAALAELDIVSPGDPRRHQIAQYLELLPVEPVRPQWPPDATLAPAAPAAAREGGNADIELVRPVYLREAVVEGATGSAGVGVTTRRARGSRVRTRVAAAGVLLGALLLGWALTRPSFAPMTPAPVARQEASVENPVDPTSASAPAAADALDDALSTAIPDPTLLAPSADAPASPAESDATPDRAAPAPASGVAPLAPERGTNVTPSASSASVALPAVASSDATRSEATGAPPPAPAAPALDMPVQSLSMPSVTAAPAPLDPGRAVTPVALPSPSPPAHTPPAPAAAPVRRADADATAVRGVLEGYASAYNTLDAEATQRVWPAVDLRGLSRAFEQLRAQTVRFERCDVKPAGDLAEAVCVGRTSWVTRVGDQSRRSEARTWQFALARDGNDWLIERVQVKR